MSENYKDMESLEEVKKLINEACDRTSLGLVIATTTILYPFGFLFTNKRIKELLYEQKLSLYTKAIQVQSVIIEKLKNKVSIAERDSKHLLAINEKLQVAIRKLKEDLGK